MYRSTLGGAVLALGLAACGGGDDDTVVVENDTTAMQAAAPATPAGQRGMAALVDAQGAQVGTVTLMQEGTTVRLTGDLMGLPAGEHGIHFHMVGTCTAPGFDSAGDHYNPTNSSHGSEHPQGPHAGDLPNITVGSDGTARLDLTNTMVSLAAGDSNSLFDADGSAIVIHADPDDYETQPSGNSGARIACGPITM